MHRALICVVITILAASAVSAATTTYDVSVALDAQAGRVEGQVTIGWTNRTSRAVERIPLTFSNPEGEELIHSATVDGAVASVAWIKDEDRSGFDAVPARPVPAGQSVRLELSFTSARMEPPRRMRYVAFHGAWLPLAPAVRDGNMRPGEEELAEFQVDLRLPSALQPACSGAIVSRQDEADGTTLYRTRARDVPGYGFAYHADWQLLETDAAGVHIRSFFFEDDAKWGRKLLEIAADVLSFYKETVGFYPQPVLSILPGYDQPYGGYPVAPNVVTVHRGLDQKPEDFARWITAHEIGHEYWGFGYVLEDRRYPRWLGLSMGIYTDRLYSRARGLDPGLHADFRQRYLGGVLAGVDTTIMQTVEALDAADFDWNNVIAHGKSFAVLEMLETVIGERALLEVFRATLQRYKGRLVTLETFRDLCEEISGKDLGWFFHQWYETNAALDYEVANVTALREDGELVTRVEVLRKGEAVMPVEVGLETSDGQLLRKTLAGWSRRSHVTFRTRGGWQRVLLDPDARLPLLSHVVRSYDAAQRAALTLLSQRRPGAAAELLERAAAVGAEQPFYWYLLGVSRLYAGDLPGAEQALVHVETLEGRPDWERQRARARLRLGNVRDLQGRREDAQALYRRCLEHAASRGEAEQWLERPYERKP